MSKNPIHVYYSGRILKLFARLVAYKWRVRLDDLLREVDAAQRMSVDELQALRDRKFVALTNYCHDHVPYYRQLFRQLGFSPGSFRGLRDLSAIPPLTKETLRQRYSEFLSDELPRLKPVSRSTGGTTGEPMTVLMDAWTSFLQEACHARGLAWSGYKMGFPTLSFTGGSLGLSKPRLRDRFSRRLYGTYCFPAFELDQSKAPALARVCRRQNIRHGMGYCSAWFLFSEHLKRAGEQLAFEAIYPTAEVLLPHWAEKIKEITGARVMDFYGCGEINALGHRPAPGAPHVISEDHAAIEVLDDHGNISPTGSGEFLITDLDNRALPLIRYRNGDAGIIADPDPALELPFRRILRLDGRINEFFYRTDGSRVSGVLATYLLQRTRIPVSQFQLCQDKVGSITLRHTPSPSLTPDNTQLLAKILKSVLGEDTKVSFEETTDFPTTASGKRRFAICRVRAAS